MQPSGLLVAAAIALATPTVAAADAAPRVRLDGDRLSLEAGAMPLVELLASVSSRSGIAFVVQGDASRIVVSDSFQDLELIHALQRVLSQYSHLLVDRTSDGSQRSVEVILLGSGTGKPAQVVRADGPADGTPSRFEESAEQLLAEAVSSATASDRAAAMEAVAYKAGDPDGTSAYAGQLLEQMLSDPDEEVRASALETLKDTADEVPFGALAQVAREDVVADRRIQALELLVERSENGESRGPLEAALNDGDPRVRKKARELMLDWHIGIDAE